jgi:hypothetical protein
MGKSAPFSIGNFNLLGFPEKIKFIRKCKDSDILELLVSFIVANKNMLNRDYISQIFLAVAKNKVVNKKTLLIIEAETTDSEVLRAIFKSHLLAEEDLINCHKNRNWIISWLIYNKHCPSNVLSHVYNYYVTLLNNRQRDAIHVFDTIGKHENTPLEVVRKIAGYKTEYVRNGALANLCKRSTDQDIVEAKSHNLPEETYNRLADSEKLEILYILAQNTSLPISTFDRLIKSVDRGVRIYLARNKSLPPYCAEVLSKDKYDIVRRNLALNSSVPKEVLKHMVADDTSFEVVRRIVAKNPDDTDIFNRLLPKDDSFGFSQMMALLNHPHTTAELLREIFNHKNATTYVKSYILYQELCPVDILEQAVYDEVLSAPALKVIRMRLDLSKEA